MVRTSKGLATPPLPRYIHTRNVIYLPIRKYGASIEISVFLKRESKIDVVMTGVLRIFLASFPRDFTLQIQGQCTLNYRCAPAPRHSHLGPVKVVTWPLPKFEFGRLGSCLTSEDNRHPLCNYGYVLVWSTDLDTSSIRSLVHIHFVDCWVGMYPYLTDTQQVGVVPGEL